jgi:parvulin-like peptidyl-prolyl isomerase
MIRTLHKIILLLLLPFCVVYPQENKILARIGDRVITDQEFRVRYELTPQLFRENRRIDTELKLEFLYSLIAEKLLAKYGEETRLDTSAIVKESLKYFEEMFVRDALYKKVIRENAKSKADSLLSYYLNNANNVQMICIFSLDETEIRNIHNLIRMGVAFDSLFTELRTGKNDTVNVSIGDLSESIEDQLFPLTDGSVSEPIKMEDGWYIFKILRRYNPVFYKTKGWENDYKTSERIAKERAELELYDIFINNFFRNKEMRVNSKHLKNLSSEIFSILESRHLRDRSSAPYSLLVSDFFYIKNNLDAETINQTIVDLGTQKYSVADFISFMRFDIFSTDTLEPRHVFNTLSNKLRKYVEYKLLADEGYKMGLQNSFEVKSQLQMWKDNYYMQLVTSTFIDSANITDQEVLVYSRNNANSIKTKKVKILQIFSDSLETMGKILAEIEIGIDFKELAKRYSINELDQNSIESGYFSITENGEVGRIADRMKIGEIYGPLKIDNRYVIFKLIDIKEDSAKISSIPNEELKRELGYLKKQNSYNNFISNLAAKYDLKLFPSILNDVQVTSHQSIIYNYLGFGGRILAVPLLNVNMDWVPEWKNKLGNIQ